MKDTAYLLHDPRAGEERTELTERAHEAGRAALSASGAVSAPVQIVWTPETGLVYALELRGQWSATGHGKTGLDPHRGALLEALSERFPVRLAILDGKVWKEAWMEELPEARPISKDPAAKRFGWDAGPNGPFERSDEPTIPTVYDPRPLAQPRLI